MSASDKIQKTVKWSVIYLIMTLLIFFVLEGFSSVSFRLNAFFKSRPFAERSKNIVIQYDELVGWVSIPNLYKKDFYGPGRHLRTNSQSFRNNRDFPVDVPEGKIRVICSGDSFTYGHGVDNSDTWCESLERLDSRIETVNLGQVAYGIDQAYLRYMRDGMKLEHDIHIFTFIEDDFYRATLKKFYATKEDKPILRLEGNNLVTENVPVPRRSYLAGRFANLLSKSISELNAVMLISEIKKKMGIEPFHYREDGSTDNQFYAMILKIFESLHKISKESGTILIAVYLPTQDDYKKDSFWRQFLIEELKKRGIIFIDLTAEFKHQNIHKMFHEHYGHYTVEGNKYVAESLYNKFRSISEIAKKSSGFHIN